jgi:hypothetical protein
MTSGVIMTTTHQFVRPLTESHWESSMSEAPNAPVMKDQIQEATFSRTLAKNDVMELWTPSFACETRPQPGGHHPFRSHSTGMTDWA